MLVDTEKQSQVRFFELFAWFWKYWKELKISFIFIVLLTPIAIGFKSYMPMFISKIFDEFAKKNINMAFVKEEVLYFFIFGLIYFSFYIVIQNLRGVTNFRLENNFRVTAFKHIVTLGQNFFQRFKTGDITTRLIDDVAESKLAWFACSGIFRFYEAVIRIGTCLFFMFKLNMFLSIVTVLPLAILVYIYTKYSNVATDYSLKTQKAISKLNSFLTTTFDGIRIIKSYNQEKNQKQAFSQVVSNQLKREIALVKVTSILQLSYSKISEITVILVFLFGGWLVINNKMSIGVLIAFNTYIFMLVWPMMDIGEFIVKGRKTGVSVNRIKELENFKADVFNIEKPLDMPEKINLQFKNLAYNFSNGNIAFRNINFSVKHGETIAIAGSLGSSKTTLIKLIPRSIDPKSGEILLNGENLKDYDISQLRKNIAYVSQIPALFSDTIKNNIIFGRENISEEEILKALKVSQLEKDLSAFPNGLDTMIGQKGVKVSGGQKQRIAIARAIIKKPKILVLDDCMSTLDAETEANLWQSLYNFIPDITIFLVTHKINTLQKADKIILMDKGQIIDIGTHKELSQCSNYYKSLYL